MANKRKVTYDLFARIIVPEDVDPHTITSIIHRACAGRGWDFAANIEEEMGDGPMTLEDILIEEDD